MSVSRVHRLLRLITLMRSQRAPTVADLAEQMEVCKRTIFRDLNMLELAGVPYYFDKQSAGYRISNILRIIYPPCPRPPHRNTKRLASTPIRAVEQTALIRHQHRRPLARPVNPTDRPPPGTLARRCWQACSPRATAPTLAPANPSAHPGKAAACPRRIRSAVSTSP